MSLQVSSINLSVDLLQLEYLSVCARSHYLDKNVFASSDTSHGFKELISIISELF